MIVAQWDETSQKLTPLLRGAPAGTKRSRMQVAAQVMALSGSVSASKISLLLIVKLRGMPSDRLRPLTSISRTSEPGNADPISFLIISAVGSPISMP